MYAVNIYLASLNFVLLDLLMIALKSISLTHLMSFHLHVTLKITCLINLPMPNIIFMSLLMLLTKKFIHTHTHTAFNKTLGAYYYKTSLKFIFGHQSVFHLFNYITAYFDRPFAKTLIKNGKLS